MQIPLWLPTNILSPDLGMRTRTAHRQLLRIHSNPKLAISLCNSIAKTPPACFNISALIRNPSAALWRPNRLLEQLEVRYRLHWKLCTKLMSGEWTRICIASQLSSSSAGHWKSCDNCSPLGITHPMTVGPTWNALIQKDLEALYLEQNLRGTLTNGKIYVEMQKSG